MVVFNHRFKSPNTLKHLIPVAVGLQDGPRPRCPRPRLAPHNLSSVRAFLRWIHLPRRTGREPRAVALFFACQVNISSFFGSFHDPSDSGDPPEPRQQVKLGCWSPGLIVSGGRSPCCNYRPMKAVIDRRLTAWHQRGAAATGDDL